MNYKELQKYLEKNKNIALEEWASDLDIDLTVLKRKINGEIDFTISEVKKIKTLYNLKEEEIRKYFYLMKKLLTGSERG